MPVYEYMCERHGPFADTRPMAASREPAPCPDCGGESPRVLLTAPRLGASDRAGVRAHETNERSADSPKRLSRHGPGCACCSATTGGRKGRSVLRADGSKGFASARPWMISH